MNFRSSRIDRMCFVACMALLGFFVSVVACYLNSNPNSTFLFDRSDQFNDFFNNYRAWHGAPAVFFPGPGTYVKYYSSWHPLPLASLILCTFSKVGNQRLAFALYIAPFLVCLFWFVHKAVVGEGRSISVLLTIALSLFSYPVIFALDRGNQEIFVFVFSALFLVLFDSGRTRLAVAMLVLATLMKPFPAVFGVLLICQKRWRDIIFGGVLYGLLSFAIPAVLWLHSGSGSFFGDGALTPYYSYQAKYVFQNDGLRFGHSIFGAIKTIVFMRGYDFVSERNVMLYFWASIGLFLAIVLFVIFVEKVLWRRVFILFSLMTLLPFVSADYRLLHVFLPMYFYFRCEEESRLHWLYCLIFSLLLVPKDSFGGSVANPSLMALMLIALIGSRVWEDRWFSRRRLVS